MAWEADSEILDAAARELARLHVDLRFEPALPGAGHDVDLTITVDQFSQHYVAEVKRRVSPASAGALRDQLVHSMGPDGVLVAPHVSTQLAHTLRDLGQQFVDSAGNLYLSAPGLRIWQVGRRPETPPEQPTESRTGAASIQIQFALLARPELTSQSFREIAAASNVSLGSVQTTMKLLDQRAHLISRDGQRELVDRPRLLDTWTPLYIQVLRPRLLIRTLVGLPVGEWRSIALPDDAQWGGEVAGAALTNYLRPQIATVYAENLPREFLTEHRLRKARPGDTDGILEVRRKFWGWDTPGPNAIVPPVLAYADLLAVRDGRCVETAGRIRDELLVPAFGER